MHPNLQRGGTVELVGPVALCWVDSDNSDAVPRSAGWGRQFTPPPRPTWGMCSGEDLWGLAAVSAGVDRSRPVARPRQRPRSSPFFMPSC